jgi:alpha-L-fucosidase
MIGNNHHLDPINGEDFQMFEQDLPGQNTAGFNFQSASSLPLESCITMNDSWGFKINDHHYKTVHQVVKTLVSAAGRNTNLLLNVGPMPNGEIGKEFTDTLALVGKWMQQYGQTVYGTRGGPMKPEKWGVTTQDAKHVYLHLFEKPENGIVFVPGNYKNASLQSVNDGHVFKGVLTENGIEINVSSMNNHTPDNILVIDKN